jgi:hypothetical protein
MHVQHDTSAPAANRSSPLDDLSWMVGHWEGEGIGGYVEEHWTRALGGCMMGMFRLIIGGETYVLVLQILAPGPDGIEYRFHHFTPQLKATLDETQVYHATSIEPNEVIFECRERLHNRPRRLIYRRVSPQELTARYEGWETDEHGVASAYDVRFRCAA